MAEVDPHGIPTVFFQRTSSLGLSRLEMIHKPKSGFTNTEKGLHQPKLPQNGGWRQWGFHQSSCATVSSSKLREKTKKLDLRHQFVDFQDTSGCEMVSSFSTIVMMKLKYPPVIKHDVLEDTVYIYMWCSYWNLHETSGFPSLPRVMKREGKPSFPVPVSGLQQVGRSGRLQTLWVWTGRPWNIFWLMAWAGNQGLWKQNWSHMILVYPCWSNVWL